MAREEARPTEYKTFPAFSLKVNEEKGIVEHIITLFGVLDHGDDISHPGSFVKTIAERGKKVRVLDMHKTDSISRILGKPVELRELSRDELPQEVLRQYPEATGGLKATTQFFIDTPEGKGAFIRAKEDAVEWSYGYDALDFDHSDVKRDGEDVRARNLRSVRLWEYGPVLFGMCPGTTTLSAKSDPAPSEAKPAPEETDNTIRIRVRAPGDFEEDSFRTINIGQADQGIKATVGRLKGENTMTVQSYIFDKEKWDVEKAQAWVDEHKKDALPDMDEKQMTEDGAGAVVPTEQAVKCECVKCGHEVESGEPCDEVKCPECGGDMREAKGDEGPEDDKVTQMLEEEQEKSAELEPETKSPSEAAVFAAVMLENVSAKLDPGTWEHKAALLAVEKLRGEWGEANGDKVAELERKVGRVLAARNAQRMAAAMVSLLEIMEDAGIDIPGFGKKPPTEEEEEKEEVEYGKALRQRMDILGAELDILELE